VETARHGTVEAHRPICSFPLARPVFPLYQNLPRSSQAQTGKLLLVQRPSPGCEDGGIVRSR